jgi:hypothetical protein
VTPAEVRAWVAETRARQGLPPTITDPKVLAELAAVVADMIMLASQKGGADAVA